MTSSLLEGWEMRGWPHRAHSRFVERGGIVWHVQMMGEGPVVLLVHGTGASTHSFRALMPLLAAHYTVVAADLPGQGFSRMPKTFEPSLPAMAAALGELLEALSLSPVAAIGHSAGVAILARMTLDGLLRPSCLVGIGAALVPLRGVAAAVLLPAARAFSRTPLLSTIIALRSDAKSVERMIRGTGSRLDAEGIELYRRLSERPRHIEAVLSMMASWELDALYGELPRLDVPVLLVGGRDDRATPPQQQHEAASRLPNANVVMLSPGGHLVHEEAPAQVASVVLPFLDRNADPAITPEESR